LSFNVRPEARTLALAQDEKCYWCGFRVALSRSDAYAILSLENGDVPGGSRRRWSENIMATFEHLKPRSKGGTDQYSNGACACYWCNSWRRHDDHDAFYSVMVRLLAAGGHPRQIYRATGIWPRHIEKVL
jgi:hypothetical protein